MKTIIIKLTRSGPRNGPFNIYDQLGNIIALNISKHSLIDGVSYYVDDSVSSVRIDSVGKCDFSVAKRVGVVTPTAIAYTPFVQTITSCLWTHLVPNLFNSYYGHTEPYILEHAYSFSFHDQILQSIKDYSKAFVYNSDDFDYTDKIETEDFFNKAWVYNNQQSSGLLELIPKPKNNLKQYLYYPIYKNDRKQILLTKSDNFYQFNNITNIVKDEKVPLFIASCETMSIDKEINNSNMIYTKQSFNNGQIRGKDLKLRLILDSRSDLHLVSQFNTNSSQISYK